MGCALHCVDGTTRFNWDKPFQESFEIFTAVVVQIVAFWALPPCSLLDRYRCFGGKYYPRSSELKCIG
jgi:hypothetical protein